MKEWHYIDEYGKAVGPLTERELKLRQAEGRIDASSTKVWREGLSSWIFFYESELDHRSVVHLPTEAPIEPEVGPPYVPERLNAPIIKFGGRGRIWVWFGPIIAAISAGTVFFAGIKLIEPELIMRRGETQWAGWALMSSSFALLFMIPIYLRLRRLRNLGMKPIMILLELVPVLNIWLWWRCFCCPEGYELSRKMDWIGWLLTSVFATALFVSTVLLWFWTTPT